MPCRHLLLLAATLLLLRGFRGQELEARAFLVTPARSNALTITYEYAAGGALFGVSLSIWSVQFYLVRIVRRRAWVAFDLNGYCGGRPTVNGTEHLDLERNSRVGGALGYLSGHHRAVKASVSRRAYTTIDEKFTPASMGYEHFG